MAIFEHTEDTKCYQTLNVKTFSYTVTARSENRKPT